MAVPKIIRSGSGERMQYLLHEQNDNTIRFVLNYPGLVDPDILRKAAKAMVESVDVLHGTFFSDGITAYWKVNENVEEHNYFHYIETAGDPSVTAYSLALLPVYPEDKVQIRVELVQGEESSSVVILLSHLVVDGGDGKYLLEKLVEAYNLILRTGSAEGLQIKDGSRAPEQIYDNFNRKEILSMMKNPLSDVKTAYPYPTEEPGMLRMVRRVIPAQTMSAARKKAKEVGASANDLLLTAFYRACAAMPEIEASEPMSILSMMDLRRHCTDEESEGLCNMSGTLPTVLFNGVQGSFGDTLLEIAAQTLQAKEDPMAGMGGLPLMHSAPKLLPMGIMLTIAGKVYGNMGVGLTNLGNLKCTEYALGELVLNGGMFGGPLKKKPGMQISAISFDGSCVLSVVGQYTKEDAQALQSTLDTIVQEIETYLAH